MVLMWVLALLAKSINKKEEARRASSFLLAIIIFMDVQMLIMDGLEATR